MMNENRLRAGSTGLRRVATHRRPRRGLGGRPLRLPAEMLVAHSITENTAGTAVPPGTKPPGQLVVRSRPKALCTACRARSASGAGTSTLITISLVAMLSTRIFSAASAPNMRAATP